MRNFLPEADNTIINQTCQPAAKNTKAETITQSYYASRKRDAVSNKKLVQEL